MLLQDLYICLLLIPLLPVVPGLHISSAASERERMKDLDVRILSDHT
jgi:hypothetical protein